MLTLGYWIVAIFASQYWAVLVLNDIFIGCDAQYQYQYWVLVLLEANTTAYWVLGGLTLF